MEHRWGERISMQAPVAIRHLNGDDEWMGLSPAAVARRIGGPAWFPESLEQPAVA